MKLINSLQLYARRHLGLAAAAALILPLSSVTLDAQLTWDGTTFLNEEQTYDGLGADADRDPLTLTSGDFNIARDGGAVGILNVVGGTLTLNNEGQWDSKVAFGGGTGELNISGGATVNLILSGTSEQRFRVADGGSSTGTINLDGGDLNVSFGHDDQTHGDRGLWFGSGGGTAIANLDSGTFTYSAPAATRIGTAGTGTINILDGAFVQTGFEEVLFGGSGRINFISGGTGYVSILGWEESDFATLVASGNITVDGSSAIPEVFLFSSEDGQGIYSLDPEALEILSQPEDQIVWAGTDVTFTVTFFGPETTEFEWQVSTDNGQNWTPITGADSLTYTIEAAGTELDGNQYRLVATHGEQSKATEPVILRVGDAEVPAPQGVVAHYRFEDGPEGGPVTGAVDSSGNGHHMEEALGSPEYTTLRPNSRIPSSGEDNQFSLELFTGDDQYAVQGTDGDSLSQVEFDSITMEAWVNFNALPGHQTIIGRDDRGQQRPGNNALVYFQKAPAGFRVEIWGRSDNNLTIDTNIVPVVGEWYHVAAVGDIDAGTLTLYVNGEEAGSRDDFDGVFVPTATATRWTIGRGQWGENDAVGESQGDWFNGRIDEVRISDVALSPVEFLNFNQSVLNFQTHPQDQVVEVGDNVTFTALAGGGSDGPPDYQWEVWDDSAEAWTEIEGADSATLTLESLEYSPVRQYRVVASAGTESVASNAATLTLNYPLPTIVQGISDITVREGDPFTFFVQAEGLGELSYEWHKDNVLLGETGNSLDLGIIDSDSAGVYTVTITDDAALNDGLDATSVTLTATLNTVVAPPVGRAIGFNFVGAASVDNPWGGSSTLGILAPEESAGMLPISNWNNSASINHVAVQTTPVPLHENDGSPSGALATWSSANTWAAAPDGGNEPYDSSNGRMFHGYVETRSTHALGQTTVNIEDIPYAQYDVYVYLSGGEGAIGRVWIDDESGREFFFESMGAGPFPRPLVQATATSVAEAETAEAASFVRFSDLTDATLSIAHTEANGGHSGGIAGIAILDTTPDGVGYPPMITARPAGRLAPAGGDIELSVTANSQNEGGSLSYQWSRDGSNIASGPSLVLSEATSADSGLYTVTVSDSSGLNAPTRTIEAAVLVVDSDRMALVNVDMQSGSHEPMSGHAILRTDGTAVVPDPDTGESNPNNIGEGDTIWNGLTQGNQNPTYQGLIDSEGLHLPGLTFSVSGATGIEDAPDGGGIDTPITDYSGPLLRDYIFTQDDDVMTLTAGGLQAFAGLEIKLVVYALGKDGLGWSNSENEESEHSDIATVTLAEGNHVTGPQSVATEIEGFDRGRDLRFNADGHAVFDGIVAANGTVSWTVGPVPESPGLNAFNGFQLLLTAEGTPITPEGIADWRLQHFGSADNAGDGANDADFDGDGFKNLVEYALGTDPTVAGAAHGAINLGRDGDFLTLTFSHIDDPNLVYFIEATNNLNEGWQEVHAFPTFNSVGTATYTDNQAVGAGNSRFIRLSVRLIE